MNQAELRTLTEERILDAEALLKTQRWSFAYYVAGYAVECALKSCVLARMIHTGWVFEEKWKADSCRTHDFEELIDLAGLRNELNQGFATSSAASAGNFPGGPFTHYWETAALWRPEVRYSAKTQIEATSLYEAITNNPDGVLAWIRNYW